LAEALPTHSRDDLERMSVDALVRALIAEEDRASRELIDECARRGEQMLNALQGVLDKDYYWSDDQTDGEWWVRFHAVMVLGLLSDERAGELLAAYMRRIDQAEDDTLAEWLSGDWPFLFRNKTPATFAAVRALAEDRSMTGYTRAEAVDVVVANAQRAGAPDLDPALASAARLA
jgi:hypothetical protein